MKNNKISIVKYDKNKQFQSSIFISNNFDHSILIEYIVIEKSEFFSNVYFLVTKYSLSEKEYLCYELDLDRATKTFLNCDNFFYRYSYTACHENLIIAVPKLEKY